MAHLASIPTADIERAIDQFVFNQRSFTTIDIVRDLIDRYRCDTGTSIAHSVNVNFGKRVAAVCARKAVSVNNRRLKATDDNGNVTTTTQWAVPTGRFKDKYPQGGMSAVTR